MIEIKISKEQIEKAEKLYKFKALNNSITKGESNIYGALGEIMTLQYFKNIGKIAQLDNTYDYDILVDNSIKIDVKTKRTTVEPKQFYNCSVAAFNTKQKCDSYFFVRILEDKTVAFILGEKSKEDFFKEATFHKKGDPDGKWEFKADCYNLPIKKLIL